MHTCGFLVCRWLCFADTIVQRVPCYGNLKTLHPAAEAELAERKPRVPPGYLSADDGSQGVRSSWTAESTETDPNTWVTDGVLKYSQLEIEARGWTADQISLQVRHSEFS